MRRAWSILKRSRSRGGRACRDHAGGRACRDHGRCAVNDLDKLDHPVETARAAQVVEPVETTGRCAVSDLDKLDHPGNLDHPGEPARGTRVVEPVETTGGAR